MVKVFLEKEKRNQEVKANSVESLLSYLEINPETILVVKNDELLNLQDKLSDKDEIKILSVISGG
jgi:sulfur carrier protein ThiS